jgi:hypothetical protein
MLLSAVSDWSVLLFVPCRGGRAILERAPDGSRTFWLIKVSSTASLQPDGYFAIYWESTKMCRVTCHTRCLSLIQMSPMYRLLGLVCVRSNATRSFGTMCTAAMVFIVSIYNTCMHLHIIYINLFLPTRYNNRDYHTSLYELNYFFWY